MNLRKKQVIDSALQLFIEKGFYNTSIQDILDKATISKGTFYNYFSSKNECFMAILEQTRYEASLRRHELIIGKDITDEAILLKQIQVFTQINKEQNLMTLFESITQSNDVELRKVLKRYRFHEIEWVSKRLTDVFGEHARPYTLELTIILFAMMHHLAVTYHSFNSNSVETERIIQTAFRNIKAILPVMLETQDILISQDSLQLFEDTMHQHLISKEDLISRFTGFKKRLTLDEKDLLGMQFTDSLLDEINRKELRLVVIETLIKPFHDSFRSTSHELESLEISNLLWHFIGNESESNEQKR